ncbi:PDR/VanB family oxidoreductase [Amycolatopsis palatopharyngis]|uniref:PDR/VanB family oxidoreductase n=1 Tax=Amycolatopsis palatopharyngis TaxID=187982 RepID=UPI000E22F465|nr:PDR/VanB family oxidoreductase [Amycolatopsis palatopharyngis]
MSDSRELVVAAREQVADGVLRLTLRDPHGEPVPAWEPGAHIDLLLAEGLQRQYSLCGDPADRKELRIAVLREPGGRGGSAKVHNDLTQGSTVRIRGPRNNFALVEAKRYLFLAGGIGITPILPMLAAADAARADWRLVYGGRTRSSMAFAGELRAAFGERVAICPQDETGLLDLNTLLGEPDPATAVYCCGPEPLLAAVQQHCVRWPPDALHVERFAAIADEGPRAGFDVELARSGKTLTVPPERSILETVEDAGVPVLSSCREGTCGTCETDVVEGTPDHRDSLLTGPERESGETMLICVSRAHCAKLVLDL